MVWLIRTTHDIRWSVFFFTKSLNTAQDKAFLLKRLNLNFAYCEKLAALSAVCEDEQESICWETVMKMARGDKRLL